ncbi:MAG: HAMP domain-containing histidine kinase [Candidatus Sungbacteria bacterium]|nr:HAMP domain-containing histidine kinase [Candidatus Sungbacteria bacterium]
MKTTFLAECSMLQLKPWQCPPILFMVMGAFIILSMLATYALAQRYTQEPEIAALAVIFITVISLIIGTFIVSGFNRLVDSHRIKSQFISLASHQLRAPLSVLKWTLEAGKNDHRGYSPQELENFMTTLAIATENMVRLVDSLIEINRIDAGTLVLHPEPIAPGKLAAAALKQFDLLLRAAHITAHLIIADNLPYVFGDAKRVTAILQRMIDNAIRYSEAGKSIVIGIEKTGTYVTFSVEDSGIGIPKQDQPHIFEKFFRTAGASRMQTEGVGTGLYIARAVIERLGGSIGFTSEEGKGSRFSFTLPIHQEGSVY